ncbi:MAG TPA: 5-dehydro-2-deoxygluconokinase [Actinomycetota bacterium]|nr:5-dehydro-2-deoxygluconokinase [Actinomycetota bacterium]
MSTEPLEAVVVGRVGADLYPAPDQLRRPLSKIERYERYVGGFAGNVATGLARLRVRVGIVSRVGDDGHGAFIRAFLEAERVDVRWLGVDPELRTALAFCEIWPPDRFPITFYRTPTCPDWRIAREELDAAEIARAPLLITAATGLARSPSRETTLELLEAHGGWTVFDLDHRPALWEHPASYPLYARVACRSARVVIGNREELSAATGVEDERGAAQRILDLGPSLVVAKRGSDGCALHDAHGVRAIPGFPAEVVNGLGAGDAFAAAFCYGLLRGLDAAEAARLGNAAGALVAAEIPCSAAMPDLDRIVRVTGGGP